MRKPPKSPSLNAGFSQARAITGHNAKTFYSASHFLPKEKRYAAYVVYAVCRLSDDAVDINISQPAQSLSRIKENIALVYSDESINRHLLLALRKTVKDYGVNKEYFDKFIAGMQMDLSKKRYKNFGELYDYSYKAAGVIGLIMLEIFDRHNEEAKDCAVALGIAMQLTNIIRDIKEDYLRGRIYLPMDEMEKFAVSETDISLGIMNENLKRLLEFQARRAKEYYTESEKGIKMIHDARCRLVVRAMKEMYEALLDEMEKNDYNVFSKRARVNGLKKAGILLKILLCR